MSRRKTKTLSLTRAAIRIRRHRVWRRFVREGWSAMQLRWGGTGGVASQPRATGGIAHHLVRGYRR